MQRPVYSIVIPTRNRSFHLRSALRSALSSQRDDYEVLVSDNSDAAEHEATCDVVRDFQSARLRYLRPPKAPLAMSPHWEWAIEQAQGEYVTVLGDDDALLPHALDIVDASLRSHAAEVITWLWAVYFWPDSPTMPNILRIPTTNPAGGSLLEVIPSKRLMESVMSLRSCYFALPMIYKAFVSRSLLTRMRAALPTYLTSQSPDIHSGMLVLHLTDHALMVHSPLSVAGQSGKSNGLNQLTALRRTDATRDFAKLCEAQGLSWPRTVPRIPVLSCAIEESFVRCQERFGSATLATGYSDERFLQDYCDTTLRLAVTPEQRAEHFRTIVAAYADRPTLQEYAIEQSRQHALPPFGPMRTGLFPEQAVIDTDGLGVRDVMDAAALTARLSPVDHERLARQPFQAYSAPPQRLRVRDVIRAFTPPIVWNYASALTRSLRAGAPLA